MTPQLYERHRRALIAAARKPDHSDYCKTNSVLEAVIERIKAEQPEAFLSAEDLPNRVFVHTPPAHANRAPVPHARSFRTGLSAAELTHQINVRLRK